MFSSLSTSYRQLLMKSILKQQNWRKTEVKTDTAIYCLVSFKLLLLSSILPSGMPLKLCFTKLKRIFSEKKTKPQWSLWFLVFCLVKNFKHWSCYYQKMKISGFIIRSLTIDNTSLKLLGWFTFIRISCITLIIINVKLKLFLKCLFSKTKL